MEYVEGGGRGGGGGGRHVRLCLDLDSYKRMHLPC